MINNRIGLKQAIKIFEEYLHYDVVLDPLYDNYSCASRIHFAETKYYWALVACEKDKIYSKGIALPVGGIHIVDKENGDIFMKGSSPLYDWDKEFENYKLKKDSAIDWKPLKNDYLNCEEIITNENIYDSEYLECTLLNREQKIETVIRQMMTLENDKCLIFFRPFDRTIGKLKIGYNVKPSKVNMKVVSKTFNDYIENSNNTLNEIKKYLRVKGLRTTDNRWIEVSKKNLKNDYPNWEFEYKLEVYNE